MIISIAKKEWSERIREGRFRVLLPVLVLLLLITTFVSFNYYAWVNQQHEAARTNARNVWVSQDKKNPHSAAHYGTYAFKPRYPLSLVDQGVDKYAGISIYLEAHKRNDAQYVAAQDQTALSRFGDLTPDFVLLFLVPLFIILVGFDAFTRERELGTFRLLRSQGVSAFSLAAGKWLSLFAVVTVVTLAVFLVAGLLLAGTDQFGTISWGALLGVLAFYLIYYAVFINLTLSVSAGVKHSGVALVVLLAVWMMACLGMPKIATRVASLISPYPTQKEFAARLEKDEQNGLDGHDPFSVAARKLEEETLRKYGVDSVQHLPFNWDGYLMQKGEEHSAEIAFRHYAALRQTFEKQSQVYRAASVLSPYLPVRFLSMAMCRTDYAAHWHFSDAAEKYRIMMMDSLNTHFARNSKYGDWDYLADKSLWSNIPDFTYTPRTYPEILQDNFSNVATLLSWLAVSFGVLFLLTKKFNGF